MTKDPDLKAGARHLIEPIDAVPDPLVPGAVKPLNWDQVLLHQLHPDQDAAMRVGGN